MEQGGSVNNNRTCQLSYLIKDRYNIESLAHLTCIGSSKEYMDCVLEELKEKGINNILALRGDIGSIGVGEFNNSQELIQYIKQNGDFGVAAACYPEGHIESKKRY